MSKIYDALEKAKEKKLTQEALELVPILEDSSAGLEELVVLNRPDSRIVESFRFLRSTIMRPPKGDPPRTILITSALMGEGKTFVSCNLAASISQSLDEHVLLIDADLRNPGVVRIFGMSPPKVGLSTYLTKSTALPELLRKTSFEKLTILPSGSFTSNPAELLSSERMKSLIREVRNRYPDRYVIIDSPPLELTPETSVIANEVDAVILVVRHGQTPRDVVKAAAARIQREKFLGVIYNGYDDSLRLYDHYRYYRYGDSNSRRQ